MMSVRKSRKNKYYEVWAVYRNRYRNDVPEYLLALRPGATATNSKNKRILNSLSSWQKLRVYSIFKCKTLAALRHLLDPCVRDLVYWHLPHSNIYCHIRKQFYFIEPR